MHNCKDTKERLIKIALDEAVLPAELSRCDECRAEFEALNATLRATARLRATVVLPNGYHARLRQRLTKESRAKAQRRKEESVFVFASSFAPLRLCGRLLKSSVPVPVPLGVAVLILFALLAIRPSAVPPQNPIVVHVPVEVPVVQEKTVTQVVYRDRRRTPKPTKRAAIAPGPENTFANLAGFKPTDEVKLTVIKGGVPNEK
jgi:anti-sigma factor RsiW